jgi:hypothetical protein
MQNCGYNAVGLAEISVILQLRLHRDLAHHVVRVVVFTQMRASPTHRSSSPDTPRLQPSSGRTHTTPFLARLVSVPENSGLSARRACNRLHRAGPDAASIDKLGVVPTARGAACRYTHLILSQSPRLPDR